MKKLFPLLIFVFIWICGCDEDGTQFLLNPAHKAILDPDNYSFEDNETFPVADNLTSSPMAVIGDGLLNFNWSAGIDAPNEGFDISGLAKAMDNMIKTYSIIGYFHVNFTPKCNGKVIAYMETLQLGSVSSRMKLTAFGNNVPSKLKCPDDTSEPKVTFYSNNTSKDLDGMLDFTPITVPEYSDNITVTSDILIKSGYSDSYKGLAFSYEFNAWPIDSPGKFSFDIRYHKPQCYGSFIKNIVIKLNDEKKPAIFKLKGLGSGGDKNCADIIDKL